MAPLPRFTRPHACRDCTLDDKAFGYTPPSGPVNAPILFVGESAGYNESLQGVPFVGAAGGTLDRLLRRSQIQRENVRIVNCLSCSPPGDWLDGAPWEYAALNKCRQYLDPVLAEPHKVIVTLGAIPLRQVLDLWGVEGVRVQDFHGTVHQTPSGRWVVPTYHPSFLQRGAINLLDVVRHDLGVARGIVTAGGWNPRPVSLLLDPTPLEFALWGSIFVQRLAADPEGIWLAVDIETKDKEGGRDEGELSSEDVSTTILRVNFSYLPDEGVTVPYEGPYIEIIEKIFQAANIVLMWNKGYDEPRLTLAGHRRIGREIWDLMWAAHHLQSDLPLGLGFWAPFYSDYGAWKHLGKQKGQEAKYAAIDGFQTTRVGHGVVKDLVEAGMWGAFYRHTHLREEYILRPAHNIGLLVDVPRLDAFHDKLQTHAAGKLKSIGEYQISGNLYPKQGYRDRPEGDPPKSVLGKHKEKGDHAKAEYIAEAVKLVERETDVQVQICRDCGKSSGVGPKHNCLRPRKSRIRGEAVPSDLVLAESTGVVAVPQPRIERETRKELRWFWQLPFNPDASQQILRFIKDSGEAPGKAKKTRKDTANKETLRKLAKKTGQKVYTDILDYKAIKKVDSTYAVGAKKRIWADGRLHPIITFRPSMGRDSCVNPNIQNCIADKGGKDALSAGFRECIVASPGCRLLEIDYCVDPAVKVLRQDLTWIAAAKITPGDTLIGFDEQLGTANKFRSSTVIEVKQIIRPRVRVTTTHGSIIVSCEHKFVARYLNNKFLKNRQWTAAVDLRPGTQLGYLCAPWETDESRDGGYLAGFFDGEGWVSDTTVGYGQNPGLVLSRVQQLLADRGFAFTESLGSSTAQCAIINGLRDGLRFLGTIRPTRLLPKAEQMWEGRRTWGKRTPVVTVISIETLPPAAVVAIKTTTGTLITDGFFSHNCGIEGVETGWMSGDADYIRLAYLGVHAYLASHLVNKPASLAWSDADLSLYFSDIKKNFPVEYDRAKRCVHGNNYGLTIHGMVENFPESFPDLVAAKSTQELYYAIAPKLHGFHNWCRDKAYEFGRLGGPPIDDYYTLANSGQHHPYGYRHWFWGVQSYRPVNEAEYRKACSWGKKKRTLRENGVPSGFVIMNGRPYRVQLGEDSKRVIAMYPQSIAAGRLKEAELELFHPDSPDYLGDMYYGRTPFRAPIHDSLLLEVPDQVFDYVIETCVSVMRRPELRQPCPEEWGIGSHLRIGVAAKAGRDWMHMEEIELSEMVPEAARETMYLPTDEAEYDDIQDLATSLTN